MRYKKIDKLITKLKTGKLQSVLQFAEGEFAYYIVYLANDFFLEKYKFNRETNQPELHGVECVDEETARFALTARY